MTSVERVRAAFEHRAPDRTPIFEYVMLSPVCDCVLGRRFMSYDEAPDAWLEYALETGYEKAVMKYARERVEIALRLGHDLLYVLPAPAPQAASPDHGLLPESAEERLALRNERDEKRLSLPMDARGFLVYECLLRAMEEADAQMELFVPAYTLGVWTDTDLMITMMTEPEIAHRHFELAADETLQYVRHYREYGIRMIGVGGDFAGNRPLISPRAYRDFIVPEVRRVSDAIHKCGAWAITASDGDVRPVLDDFLVSSRVDGYMEIDQRAGMEMADLKRAYGDRICLMGNVDCGNLMSFGTAEEIRAEVHRCLDEGYGNGGHIFTCSNAISASISPENYRALNDAYREHFGLSKAIW